MTKLLMASDEHYPYQDGLITRQDGVELGNDVPGGDAFERPLGDIGEVLFFEDSGRDAQGFADARG